MNLIWVHADCLHRQSPAYRAYPDAPSIFVWDDAELRRAGWSLKRIGFVYECLLDLPVFIRRGDPVAEVLGFAREMQCSGITAMASPDPRIQAQAAAMGAEMLPLEPFVELKEAPDLRSFSRYWRKVESTVLGDGSAQAKTPEQKQPKAAS
jgi:hypothetical protein